MLKQKLKAQLSVSFSRATFITIAAVLVLAVVATVKVRADQFDQQISQLQQQNDQTKSTINQLQSQASSYQDAINKLQTQINSLQADINNNLARQAQLKQQITDAEIELDKQKVVLGDSIREMYTQGQISNLELLASSQNLSDFVDQQVYQGAVQDQIKQTLDNITALKLKLQDEKNQVEQLLKDQQTQQLQLGGAQQQQSQLLAYNQGQQSAYNQQISDNQAKIVALRVQQFAANNRLLGSGNVSVISSGSCGGSYPGDAAGPYGHWGCNYSLDQGVDNWGMYNRECVSYTAWKVFKAYGYMPYWGGSGNANQWPSDADAYHIPRGNTPKVGSVAIGTNPNYFGSLGHSMWVEAISGNNILVSQFNFGSPGQYSQMWISSSLMNTFIYFGG